MRINAQFVLCAVVLTTIALVQVLPQVDLPDTAFHEDTAPVVMKYRVLSSPIAITIADVRPAPSVSLVAFVHEPGAPSVLPMGASRQALFSSFLC